MDKNNSPFSSGSSGFVFENKKTVEAKPSLEKKQTEPMSNNFSKIPSIKPQNQIENNKLSEVSKLDYS